MKIILSEDYSINENSATIVLGMTAVTVLLYKLSRIIQKKFAIKKMLNRANLDPNRRAKFKEQLKSLSTDEVIMANEVTKRRQQYRNVAAAFKTANDPRIQSAKVKMIKAQEAVKKAKASK